MTDDSLSDRLRDIALDIIAMTGGSRPCPDCEDGTVPTGNLGDLASRDPCSNCDGSGRVKDCPGCDGTGFDCNRCFGRGTVPADD